jgi:hypothetical protein
MIHDDMICKYETKARTKTKLQTEPKLIYKEQNFPPLKREAHDKLPS